MAKTVLKGNKGFTIIELSMVLVITAVMAAVAIPILTDSMHSVQLESEARKIASAMSYAKLGAVSGMTNYELSFDIDQNQWSLSRLNKSLDPPSYEFEQQANGLADGINDSGIAFKSYTDKTPQPDGFGTTSSQLITFSPRGIPDSAGIVYLSNEELDYAVSVSIVGKVQIWKYKDSQWTAQ